MTAEQFVKKSSSRRGPVRPAAAILIIIGIGVAAGYSWSWRRSRALPPPLEPSWEATVVTLAGDGVAGWRDGDADRARLSDPFGVAVAADGTTYVADAGDAQRIRAIVPSGVVSTLAGSVRGFADGMTTEARFDTPSGLAIDGAGAIVVADTGNNAIRRITADGRVTTVAGDGAAGYRDGRAQEARFNGPIGVAVDRTGRIIVADTYNDRIRAIATDGAVSTLGSELSGSFNTPCGVAVDAAGNIYVADTGSNAIRIMAADGAISTASWEFPEGLVRPIGIAIGPASQRFVTDDRGRIVEITANGAARTIAGSIPGFRDGRGQDARFRHPTGIVVAKPGRIIVSDSGNSLVRLVSATSQLELRVPARPDIKPRFDIDSFAELPLLWPIAPMEGPHEIAGTLGEARGGEGTERFHAGIDVRVDEGTPVLAVRDGTVASPLAASDFGTLNESIRIGPLAYVHVRAGRTRRGELLDATRFVPAYDENGKPSGMRVKRGARFVTGEPIATVNAFNHIHLNVGWPGEEYNPLRLRLAQFEDTIPPTIGRGGVKLVDETGAQFTRRLRGRVLVFGRVHIVVDAWDQIDGNRPNRRLGVYALGYKVLPHTDGGDGPTPNSIQFDRLTWDPEAPRVIYAPGSGIPFYGRRVTRLLYAVTNTFHDGVPSAGAWDTTALAPGNYTVRIYVRDVSGNVTTRDVRVTVERH
jgi:sugar lactone lactonase YvrE